MQAKRRAPTGAPFSIFATEGEDVYLLRTLLPPLVLAFASGSRSRFKHPRVPHAQRPPCALGHTGTVVSHRYPTRPSQLWRIPMFGDVYLPRATSKDAHTACPPFPAAAPLGWGELRCLSRSYCSGVSDIDLRHILQTEFGDHMHRGMLCREQLPSREESGYI